MAYDVYLRREVIDFLHALRRDERDALLAFFESLGRDPYRSGDFNDQDASGRDIEVIIFGRCAIWYWADHAVKELKIVDVRFADL